MESVCDYENYTYLIECREDGSGWQWKTLRNPLHPDIEIRSPSYELALEQLKSISKLRYFNTPNCSIKYLFRIVKSSEAKEYFNIDIDSLK